MAKSPIRKICDAYDRQILRRPFLGQGDARDTAYRKLMDFLDCRIASSELYVRSRHLLESLQVRTYRDLIDSVKRDPLVFRRARNFGKKSYYSLMAYLDKEGVELPSHLKPEH